MFRRSDATLDRTPLPTGRPQPCPVEGRLTWGGADFIGDWNWSGCPCHRSGKLVKAWVLAPASQKKRSISFGYREHCPRHLSNEARDLPELVAPIRRDPPALLATVDQPPLWCT